MKSSVWKWLTPLTFVLFIGSFYLITKDVALVAVITVCLLIHELAHLVALKILGYKSNLIFLPFLGAGTVPSNTEEYLKSPDSHKAVTALAGPAINALLLLVSIPFMKNPETYEVASLFFNINFLLVLINLAPIGPFDGSKIASAILKGTGSWVAKVPLMIYFVIISISSLMFFIFGYEAIETTWIIITIIVVSILGVTAKLAPSSTKTEAMAPGQTIGVFASYLAISAVNFLYLYKVLFP